MSTNSKNGLIGLGLIGIGAGLTAVGVALVVPVCVSWSRTRLQTAFQKGKEGVISGIEIAAGAAGELAVKAQHPLSEAAKAARGTTAIAAGAVESAAHYIRERVS
jgi:hypothetical protein